MNKIKITILILALSAGFFSKRVYAQDELFIYGKVSTVEGRSYEGSIRWGNEEVFWSDIFNASKRENENIELLNREDKEYLESKKIENYNMVVLGINNWGRTYHFDYTHQFNIQFGEIKSISPVGRGDALLELKSGQKIRVKGEGYNDLSSRINVYDKEVGEMKIEWESIDKIEFMPTPAKLKSKFGEPLVGTVETHSGSFSGIINWDKEERLSVDKLDGKTEDGSVSIDFGNIKSITKEGNKSRVELKSGRVISVWGSNDVNYENRGVVVCNENYGTVEINWEEFKKITLEPAPAKSPFKYDDFKGGKELSGTVKTSSGKILKGKLVYDLDEAYGFELLQGKRDEVEFITPMKNVKRISPKNSKSSEIELINGDKILLKDGQDINKDNEGLMVFESGKNVYVRWEDVTEITFD